MLRNHQNEVLLQQRPPSGIWGGLWCLPECEAHMDIRVWCRQQLGLEVITEPPWTNMRHSFTHFDLAITPVPARLAGENMVIMENTASVWYNPQSPDARGLATPVKRLVNQLRKTA
jgi:A/G-specific adenine glycosylase